MSPSELVRAYLERVIARADAAALDSLVDPSFINHDPPPGMGKDRAGLKQIVAFLHQSFDGFAVEVSQIEDVGDGWVTARSHLAGRLTRPLFGQPAGAQVRIPIVDQFRVVGERIVERRQGT
jgi:hypothetical protein